MIKSFRDTNVERIFTRQFVRKFPRDIQQRVFMKLNAIDAATNIRQSSLRDEVFDELGLAIKVMQGM